MEKLIWTKDGDQWIAKSHIAEYRITEIVLVRSGGSEFSVTAKKASGRPRPIGGASALDGAKAVAGMFERLT